MTSGEEESALSPKRNIRNEALGIVLCSGAVYLFLAGLKDTTELSGWVGAWARKGLLLLFGTYLWFLAPLGLFAFGLWLMTNPNPRLKSRRLFGLCLFGLSLAAILQSLSCEYGNELSLQLAEEHAGLVGGIIAYGLGRLFGIGGRYLVISASFCVSLALAFSVSPSVALVKLWRGLACVVSEGISSLEDYVYGEEPPEVSEPAVSSEPVQEAPQQPQTLSVAPSPPETKPVQLPVTAECSYKLPPLSLLQKYKFKAPKQERSVDQKKGTLEETLKNFGVDAKVVNVTVGPSVTRFEVQPAPGVKVATIASLANDIALNMAASNVRIEAPVPGKSVIGIEIPNKETAVVHLREILGSDEFHNNPSKLTVALGKEISGKPVVSDLEKLLHLLIAGATGSGKSVCINCIISSLLYKATPGELKFVMIDPKMVELSVYDGIPHLIAPVVTDPKKAAGCLRWVVNEMENRYRLFVQAGVRDITRYNQLADREFMPYIVVIIDELSDLMMVAPVDVEDAIFRLAQMARAAGIHLVVATQRPSVDVLTGTIKANIPSRIAFAVSSQVDSRTILDSAGAEKLLGRGDMLFFPVGVSRPIRAQGALITEREIEQLVEYVKAQGQPEYKVDMSQLEQVETEGKIADEDPLFPQAVRAVIEAGQASVSLLQRKLPIGYARAARLIDCMEERGFIGPYEGSKPREVKIKLADYDQLFGPGQKNG
ncbi:MAG TPA: DNA translocase FtsK [Firmicutes bacterium]|nr:DNA translocase FtsK [Bacillota bacterium]